MFGPLTKPIENKTDRFIICLIAILIFFIPTNWFIKLGENQAYVHGLLSDYLLIKIYVTDLLILLISILLVIAILRRMTGLEYFSKNKWLVLTYALLGLVLIVKPIATEYRLIGVISSIKLVGLTGLVILLRQWWQTLKLAKIKEFKLIIGYSALVTVLFQSCVGLYQFIGQKSLLGYAFLGETQLSGPVNIARLIWRGRELVLPYGTTAHPNVLAGSLVILLVISWSLLAESQNRIVRYGLWLTLLVGILSLIITASFSGILAIILSASGFAYLQLRKTKKLQIIKLRLLSVGWILIICLVPIILAIFASLYTTDYSILRRTALNQSGVKMILDHPLLGTGSGLFTARLDQYLSRFEPVVFLQPVHHVPLLFLAQTGLVGLVWVWAFWRLISKPQSNQPQTQAFPLNPSVICLMVLPLLTLDHYLLSLQTGLMLSTLILWLGGRGSGGR